jgi:tetratricopeptide (TPR) repeat protein
MIGGTLGPYRLEGRIDTGGTGVVYRARDTRVARSVAVRLLTADAGGGLAARLPALAPAVVALDHPNICRTLDLVEASGQVWVVTELVEGSTLQAARPATGFPPGVIAALGAQVASALSYAHERGVIHGALTGRSIVVTPGGRVKVQDFGLSRSVLVDTGEALTHSQSLTDDADGAGTASYVAPEVLSGESATPASDIWSLGVVLFEMTAGSLPFTGRSIALAGAILDAPMPPLPTAVPAPLGVVIRRCLEKNPARRFPTASDARRALESCTGRRAASRRAAWMAGTAAGLVVCAVLGTAYWRYVMRDAGAQASRPAPARRSVAVLGFKSLSGQPAVAWVSTAVAEMLTTELAAGEQLRVIPGEAVADMKRDLALSDGDALTPEMLVRIRSHLGSDLVVLGTYAAGTGTIRLDVRVQDATTGGTLASVADSGNDAELLDVVSRAGARLRERLGVSGLSPAETAQVRASRPANTEAARLYAEGLERLRVFDAQQARLLFERAVAADPKLPMAHSALAEAWSSLGYDAKAQESARRAFELSVVLTREDRLWIEGRYRETINERLPAIEAYRTLVAAFPDNLEYGLRLAGAQTAAGRAAEALATVEALRGAVGAARDDPRLDLAESLAAGALSSYTRQQEAASRAARRGDVLGARLVVARARLSEGAAWRELGERTRAIHCFDEAKRIYAAAGDRGGEARAVRSEAVVRRTMGELDAARRLYDEALATSREIGDQSGVAQSLNNIGNILRQQGSLSEAYKTYASSLAIHREIGDRRGVSLLLNNMGIVQRQLGDFRGAKRLYAEALEIRRSTGDRTGVAATLNNIANVLYDEGDLAASQAMYEESLAIRREIGDKRGEASSLFNIAGILRLQGDLKGARGLYEQALTASRELADRSLTADALASIGGVLGIEGDSVQGRARLEEALAIRREIGERNGVAFAQLSLAELAVGDGQYARAEALARQAVEHFRPQKTPNHLAQATVTLAEALVAQGRMQEARSLIGPVTAASPSTRFQIALVEARLESAAGRAAHASGRLRRLLATTRVTLEDQLEARLVLGEIDIARGQKAAARAELTALARDAGDRGFGLVARRAAAAAE